MPPKIFARGDKLEDGHYTVLEEIGVGGMGVVYHCRDELLLRDVAIKMLLPSLMADKKNLEVFKEEARLAAQLEHPNIVTVYDIGVESRNGRDHHFVAMEYLPGGNLANRVTQGALPLEHALNWMKQLSSGLSFAHKRGVIHQDIKADNIFITNEGDLKIGDFGLARLLVGRVYLNSATKGMGTPAYMSPELCRGDQQDHRSDIYSMGILFFEMCTGQLPYRAQGMIEMAMKHTSAPVPSAKRLNPQVPDILDKVIKRMMAKTPDERYRSMADVLGIIDDLIFELRLVRMGFAGRLENGKLKVSDLPETTRETKESSETKDSPPPPVTNPPKNIPVKLRDLPEEKLRQLRQGDGVDTTKVVPSTSQNKLKSVEPPPPSPGIVSPPFVRPQAVPELSFGEEKPRENRIGEKVSDKANQVPLKKNPTPGSSQVLWTYSTKGPIGWSAAPVLNREGNIVYFPSCDGRLYAVDSRTGQLHFAYDAGAPLLSAPFYTPDKLVVSDCSGMTHAIDPTSGEPLWKHEGGAALLAGPSIYGNTLMLCDRQGLVTGLDIRLGRKLWSFNAGDAIVAQPKVHGDSLYFGTQSGSVHSLACATGRQNWKFAASGRIVSTPVTSVDTVYLGTQSGAFFALDAEAGRLIWEYPSDGAINRGGIIVFTSVMFASNGKWLYCCEKYDGTLKWKAPLKGKPAATLTSVDRHVLAVSREGFLEAIDTRNGAIAWRLALKKEIESQPLFIGNLMYFGAVDGDLVCLELSAAETKAKAGST